MSIVRTPRSSFVRYYRNYTPQFEAVVVEGGAASLMCTYAKSNTTPGALPDKRGGVYGCANHRALTTLLRERWGFSDSSYVVSDCGAVHDAAASLTAGCDLECPFGHQSNAQYNKLANLSRAGMVSESAIDVAVGRLLGARMRLGEFDAPATVEWQNVSRFNTAALQPALERLSEEAARSSLVLLKNTNRALPLVLPSSTVQGSWSRGRASDRTTSLAVAVVGIESFGHAGYNTGGDSDAPLTSAALAVATGPRVQVRTAPGCLDGPSCEMYDAGAVWTAIADASAVLVFLGTGGEEGEMHDLDSLQLKGNQTNLLDDAIAAAPATAPVIVILFTCAPLNITAVVSNPRVSAVLQAFYPQHGGGRAITNALLGRCDDGLCFGRLPYTWPADLSSAGDLGNYTMLGTQKTFRYGAPKPLFPFAFGLQYAGPFEIGNVTVAKTTIAACQSIELSLTLRNTGTLPGSEIVQVYLRWLKPTVATPTLQLVQFERVFVPAGAERHVLLTVDARRMAVLLPPPRNHSAASHDATPTHSDNTGVEKSREGGLQGPIADWWLVPLQMQLYVGASQPGFGDTVSTVVSIAGDRPVRVSECKTLRRSVAQK